MAGSAGKVTVALIAVVVLVLLVVIVLGLGIGLGVGLKSRSSNYVYRKAAVATDAAVCSQVGVEILKKGGSAVDSAIASMFCVGTVNIHSTGIGGGGFLAYYNATSGRSTFLDFREVAPMAATVNMFSNASSSAGECYGTDFTGLHAFVFLAHRRPCYCRSRDGERSGDRVENVRPSLMGGTHTTINRHSERRCHRHPYYKREH